MINNKDKIAAERELISLLLKNKDLVGDWIESPVKIPQFDGVHKYILEAIIMAYNNDVCLTRKTYVNFLENIIPSKLDRQSQEYVYNAINMLSVKRDDFPLLLQKIQESFIDKSTIKFIEEYQESIKKGSLYAAKMLHDRLSGIVADVETKKPIIYDSISNYHSEYYKKLQERIAKGPDEEGIKTHIKEIDETMVVGPSAGTLTLFCGDVGGYKSTIMLNVAMNIWEHSKKNVLYIPLEMPREKMYQKFLSRFLQIPFDKLEHPTLLSKEEVEKVQKADEKIKEIENKNNSKFFIMEAPEQIPVSVIRREIEKYLTIFKPHIVVVDYIANLVPDDSTYRKDRNDLEIGNMLKALRTMGKPGAVHEEGFGIISGAQIGREALKRIRRSGINKTAFYSEDIRGSHEYSADSDNMYAQMEDPQQPGQRLHLFCIKSRYGKKQFSNGSNKAVLELRPEISLIKSMNNAFYVGKHSDIMNKIADADKLDFSSEENEAQASDQKLKNSFDAILGIN